MKIIILITSILLLPVSDLFAQALLNNSDLPEQVLRKPISPKRFGIKNNGTLISKTNLYEWLNACKEKNSPVYFPAGKYLLPADFEFDFGNHNIAISGDGPEKSMLSTYNGPESNFAIPEKVNLTKRKPAKDGVYQVDVRASIVHHDFTAVSNVPLDSYIQIEKNKVKPISFATVKALGYVTELDTEKPDPGTDGLYVVAKHAYHEYGGGFAHLTLGFTGAPLYLQGTVLQRKDGTWSRYYSSIAFIAGGNFSVKNISFRNFRPYLFLPSSKKRNTILKTSDHFIIENCKFEHTARIVSTMAYGGISDSVNWYKASGHYPIDGNLRFKNFIIRNNDFSYIHESIVWGTPPSSSYKIFKNKLHDCYTLLNCFYLFPPYNTSMPVPSSSNFSITNNSFIRIRALNPGSENTIHLIRTMNKGIVSNNVFIDCTSIHLYLNGSTKVTGNLIRTFMAPVPAAQPRPPLILVKTAKNEMITISKNTISMGMMGNLVANESQASFTVIQNKLIGPGTRYISNEKSKLQVLDKYRTYTVTDTVDFKALTAKGTYDSKIGESNTIFYNSRSSLWEPLAIQPLMYLFSEVNNFNANKQHILFSENEIETNYLTRIQKNARAVYSSVVFENNHISNCTGFNAGNDLTVIDSYRFTGNKVTKSSLSMTSLAAVTTSVRKLEINENTFEIEHYSNFLFSASDTLILRKNSFTRHSTTNKSAGRNKANGRKKQSATSSLVTLTGHPGQEMFVEKNSFIPEIAKASVLSILNPGMVSITGNNFIIIPRTTPASTGMTRNAIFINSFSTFPTIKITGNNFYLEDGIENYLVKFDEGFSAINNFTLTGNKLIPNKSYVVKTIVAGNKSFKNYYHGRNSFKDNESIFKISNKININ